jgi:hypothetical protein
MGRSRKKNSITAEQWFWFDREALESPAFRQLSLSALRVYFRLALEYMHHAGKENGRLPVTYDQFVEYGIHRHAIAPAIRELVALGFIKITQQGKASAGEHAFPNYFRLTDRPTRDDLRTCDWKRIKTDEDAEALAKGARNPPKKAQRRPPKKIIFPVMDSVTSPVMDSVTGNAGSLVMDSVTTVPVMDSVTTSISAVPMHPKQKGDDAALETQAVGYARWVAKRDGITLPSSVPGTAIWTRKGNGTKQEGISAVSFGDTRIDIPHWDWKPNKPVRGLA